MLDKIRQALRPKGDSPSKLSVKNWVAYVLFGAIIAVFALWGVHPNQYGDSGATGVAATVNESPISLNEYRMRLEAIESNARGRFDQFPEAQKRMIMQQMRQRALDELILTEVVYQAATQRGIAASDSEVRDLILAIPIFQDNGRFKRDRYAAYLQQSGLTSEGFEAQIRKQIVVQKLQDMFVASAAPSREEMSRSQKLANQKLNVRFAQVQSEDVAKLIGGDEVKAYVTSNKEEIEKHYNSNKVEFSSPEKVKAKHILVRTAPERSDADALALIQNLKKEATPQNFASLASKSSEDPGSKTKGGDLGEFERGRMVPAFDQAAFSLPPGQVSEPIKTDYGYHLILVEEKKPGRTAPLAEVQDRIARQLIAAKKEAQVIADVRKYVQEGDKKQLDSLLQKAGTKWQESGEFDMSSGAIPKLGNDEDVLNAIYKKAKPGLVPDVVTRPTGGFVVTEIVSWKDVPAPKEPDVLGANKMLAYRKSSDLIETWAKEAESKARIQRNPQLTQ